jgi:hypothetical protein
MKNLIRIHLFFLLALTGLTFIALPALAAPPGAQLNIIEVQTDVSDPSNPKFTIFGENMDVGPGPLSVTLGASTNVLNIISENPTVIEAELNETIPAGDYLLAVSRGIGKSQNDEYDLTIGAIGPKGLQGERGPSGEDGSPGIPGPQTVEGLLQRVSQTHNVPIVFGQGATLGVECPQTNPIVISGGCDLPGADFRILLKGSFSGISTSTGRGAWFCRVFHGGQDNRTSDTPIIASALCAN